MNVRCFLINKNWKKFGDSGNDPAGVNSATTVVADEVLMQFLNNKEVDYINRRYDENNMN